LERTTGKRYYYNTLTRKTMWQKPSTEIVPPKTPISKTAPGARFRSQTVAAKSAMETPNLESFDADLDPQRENRILRAPTEGLPQVLLMISVF
jgi:hypothetical protein